MQNVTGRILEKVLEYLYYKFKYTDCQVTAFPQLFFVEVATVSFCLCNAPTNFPVGKIRHPCRIPKTRPDCGFIHFHVPPPCSLVPMVWCAPYHSEPDHPFAEVRYQYCKPGTMACAIRPRRARSRSSRSTTKWCWTSSSQRTTSS